MISTLQSFTIDCGTCRASVKSQDLKMDNKGLRCPKCERVLVQPESRRFKAVLDHRRAGGK